MQEEVSGAVLRADAKQPVDLPAPLWDVPGLANANSITCQDWTKYYGPDAFFSGCGSKAILQSPKCDAECQDLYGSDPNYMSKRCPSSCARGREGRRSHYIFDSAQTSRGLLARKTSRGYHGTSFMQKDAKSDMPAPLWDSAGTPTAALTVGCQAWVQFYGADVFLSGCDSKQLLQSPKCDAGCQALYARSPHHMRKRCPQTCARGREAYYTTEKGKAELLEKKEAEEEAAATAADARDAKAEKAHAVLLEMPMKSWGEGDAELSEKPAVVAVKPSILKEKKEQESFLQAGTTDGIDNAQLQLALKVMGAADHHEVETRRAKELREDRKKTIQDKLENEKTISMEEWRIKEDMKSPDEIDEEHATQTYGYNPNDRRDNTPLVEEE